MAEKTRKRDASIISTGSGYIVKYRIQNKNTEDKYDSWDWGDDAMDIFESDKGAEALKKLDEIVAESNYKGESANIKVHIG